MLLGVPCVFCYVAPCYKKWNILFSSFSIAYLLHFTF
jgi:hypothetical protein